MILSKISFGCHWNQYIIMMMNDIIIIQLNILFVFRAKDIKLLSILKILNNVRQTPSSYYCCCSSLYSFYFLRVSNNIEILFSDIICNALDSLQHFSIIFVFNKHVCDIYSTILGLFLFDKFYLLSGLWVLWWNITLDNRSEGRNINKTSKRIC